MSANELVLLIGLGAFAAGVGTTDLEVGILKGVCAFKTPDTLRIDITGTLADGVYAKDVILSVIARLGVNGATNKVIEFSGPVVDGMSMAERMTLCNMAVEAGGTCGICRPDETTLSYLWPRIRSEYSSRRAAREEFERWAPRPITNVLVEADAVDQRLLPLLRVRDSALLSFIRYQSNSSGCLLLTNSKPRGL